MEAVPIEIKRLDRQGIRIVWQDEHESVFENVYLRLRCQCASCVQEWTGERIVQPEMLPKDIHPTSIEPIGRYAISIHWSDGHETGIYPFDYLRQICPCPLCRRDGIEGKTHPAR